MFRKKNRALACAIAGMGMLASTAASALTIDLAFTADNVVNSWWVVNSSGNVVDGAVLSTASSSSSTDPLRRWQLSSTAGVNLAPGDYKVVFGATNALGDAGFLAEISGAELAASSQLLTSQAWKGAEATLSDVTFTQNFGQAFVPSLPTLAALEYESNASDLGTWKIVNGIATDAHWIWANLDGGSQSRTSVWLMGEITVVPIPAAGVLFFSAIAGLVLLGRRRLRAGQEALPV